MIYDTYQATNRMIDESLPGITRTGAASSTIAEYTGPAGMVCTIILLEKIRVRAGILLQYCPAAALHPSWRVCARAGWTWWTSLVHHIHGALASERCPLRATRHHTIPGLLGPGRVHPARVHSFQLTSTNCIALHALAKPITNIGASAFFQWDVCPQCQ